MAAVTKSNGEYPDVSDPRALRISHLAHNHTPPTSTFRAVETHPAGSRRRGPVGGMGFKGAAAKSGAVPRRRVCSDAESRLVGLNPPWRSCVKPRVCFSAEVRAVSSRRIGRPVDGTGNAEGDPPGQAAARRIGRPPTRLRPGAKRRTLLFLRVYLRLSYILCFGARGCRDSYIAIRCTPDLRTEGTFILFSLLIRPTAHASSGYWSQPRTLRKNAIY